MVKEMTVSLDYGFMHKLLVQTDPTNEDLTRVKRRVCTMEHPKKLLDVLRAIITIAQGLTGNNITTGPN